VSVQNGGFTFLGHPVVEKRSHVFSATVKGFHDKAFWLKSNEQTKIQTYKHIVSLDYGTVSLSLFSNSVYLAECCVSCVMSLH